MEDIDITKYPYRPGDPYDHTKRPEKDFGSLTDEEKKQRQQEVKQQVDKYRKIAEEFDKKFAQEKLLKELKEQEEAIKKSQEEARIAQEEANRSILKRNTLLATAASLGIAAAAYMIGTGGKTRRKHKKLRKSKSVKQMRRNMH